MSEQQTVWVNLGERSYDIEIGSGNLAQTGPFVAGLRRLTHAIVVTDVNVEDPHAAAVADSLAAAGAEVDVMVVDSGEGAKSIDMAGELWQRLLEAGADRKSIVCAVGGGVVGDLAGFVAATFARGIPFVQVPTTLLAQVDSSVGGKVGVNLPGAKNMVGSFWQPLGVLIDTETLSTLPEREYRAGLGEVVKYGVILDAPFFDYLEKNVDAINARQPEVLRHVIARCCRLKADVVERDERETTGLRAVLNYGHTFCHAIEAVAGYGEYLHGEAVAIGMICASRLAESLERVDSDFTARQAGLLQQLGLSTATPDLDRDLLLAAMGRDKKVEHGKLRFVLPSQMGHVELVGDVPPELARAAFA
ncbi:3-dehydroquinate synthase [Lignipirellula cremea]|uniref:3-dehydroquinate synthase n=1 Tax=Lignipirellula cremea TaxID=2528010 RepID=A0A518DLK5_9BACT|nr:3-dehydroquinate synthase [Lignipirellula cremea]QDU92720.1 3-dehydroquinate synthase [Lignipirellula cremea]